MRISSTPLLDAASSSWMLYDLCWLNATHDSQLLHASLSGVRFMQLIVFAKMRAQVVLPTPRGPLKRYACASLLPTMAFFNVVVRASCPTTLLNVDGLYFLAETIKVSMYIRDDLDDQ